MHNCQAAKEKIAKNADPWAAVYQQAADPATHADVSRYTDQRLSTPAGGQGSFQHGNPSRKSNWRAVHKTSWQRAHWRLSLKRIPPNLPAHRAGDDGEEPQTPLQVGSGFRTHSVNSPDAGAGNRAAPEHPSGMAGEVPLKNNITWKRFWKNAYPKKISTVTTKVRKSGAFLRRVNFWETKKEDHSINYSKKKRKCFFEENFTEQCGDECNYVRLGTRQGRCDTNT